MFIICDNSQHPDNIYIAQRKSNAITLIDSQSINNNYYFTANGLVFFCFVLHLYAHTLVPFCPIKNFSSDSTPFKMTDTLCSTVDSVK